MKLFLYGITIILEIAVLYLVSCKFNLIETDTELIWIANNIVGVVGVIYTLCAMLLCLFFIIFIIFSTLISNVDDVDKIKEIRKSINNFNIKSSLFNKLWFCFNTVPIMFSFGVLLGYYYMFAIMLFLNIFSHLIKIIAKDIVENCDEIIKEKEECGD